MERRSQSRKFGLPYPYRTTPPGVYPEGSVPVDDCLHFRSRPFGPGSFREDRVRRMPLPAAHPTRGTNDQDPKVTGRRRSAPGDDRGGEEVAGRVGVPVVPP